MDAEQAFDLFLSTYEAKYPKATECLAKDRDTLLTFYDFPAEHWLHIRTTNPIEIDVRDRAFTNHQDAWLCFARRHSGHGLQVDQDRRNRTGAH